RATPAEAIGIHADKERGGKSIITQENVAATVSVVVDEVIGLSGKGYESAVGANGARRQAGGAVRRSGRKSRRVGGDQFCGASDEIADKNIGAVIIVVRDEAAIGCFEHGKVSIGAQTRNGCWTDGRSQAVGIGIEQGRGAGLEVADVEMVSTC